MYITGILIATAGAFLCGYSKIEFWKGVFVVIALSVGGMLVGKAL